MATAYTTVAPCERSVSDKMEPLLSDEDQLFIDHSKSKTNRGHWTQSPAWIFSSFALLFLLLAQNIYYWSTHTYERGFPTELGALKPSLKLQERRFTGPIHDQVDGSMQWIASTDKYGRVFAGPPTEDIDAAWDELIYGRYVNFTQSEVAWLNNDNELPHLTFINVSVPSQIEPGFYGGPDMLHTLHCVNALRKHLDLDYYRDRMTMFPRMHVDHCVDQLRQAALCHGDLTPVTLKPVKDADGKVHILLGETERTHTCRNGEELADAWRRRGEETGRFNVT